MCKEGFECTDHCFCKGGGQGVTCCGPEDPACQSDPKNACGPMFATTKLDATCTPTSQEATFSVDNPAFVYKKGGTLQGRYTLWIPPGVCPVKFVYIRPLYGDDPIRDERVRQMVTRLSGAVLVADFKSDPGAWHNAVLKGTGISIAQALLKLATASQHPELAVAPWVPMGFSGGAALTTHLTAQFPNRIAAAVPVHGAGPGLLKSDALSVPILFIAGKRDNVALAENDGKAWAEMRAGGSPSTYLLEDYSHNWGNSPIDLDKYLTDILPLRLPKELPSVGPAKLQTVDTATGFVGDNTSRVITPVSQSADPTTLSWLPTQAFADFWAVPKTGK